MRRSRWRGAQRRTSSGIPAPRERAAPTNCPARPSARARDRRRSPRARSRADRGRTAWPPGSCRRRTAAASAQSRSRNLLRAEGLSELRDPEIHEVEVGIHASLTSGVGRHDDCFRTGTLRHVHDLIAIIVVRRQQHLNVLVPHGGDEFLHAARRGGSAGLRLDVIEAGDLELAREIVPFLVVARDPFYPERRPLLEPTAQPVDEWRALILLLAEEVEELALAIEVGQRLAADQLYQVVAEQRAVHPVLDRKSTRLNSSHSQISYAVFCLKKKKNKSILKQQCKNTTS